MARASLLLRAALLWLNLQQPATAQFRLPEVREPLPIRLIQLSEGSEGGESEEDEIETDRDSFTPATTTTASGRMIIESAWSFIDNRNVPDTNSLPELVTRIGLNDWLELRIGFN